MTRSDAKVLLTNPPELWPPPNYSHCARAGDFLFLAGQIARDGAGHWVGLGDAGAQARQIYENIGAILAHAGASPADVVKVTTILTNRADNPAVTAQRVAFFGAHRPPHTGMIVQALGSPEVLLEVEVVAYRPRGTD